MTWESPEEESFGLVMPFVVCEDQGGPYKADAFVAGCYFGRLQALLESKLPEVMQYIPSPLTPQIDLLAMKEGYSFKATPWDDHPDEWTFVELTRQIGVPS